MVFSAGILFSLLLEARPNDGTRRKERSDKNAYSAFAKLINPNFRESVHKAYSNEITKLKNCTGQISDSIGIRDITIMNRFDGLVQQYDEDLLNQVSIFIDEFLDPARLEWLCSALLEALSYASKPDEDQLLYVNRTKGQICKRELLEQQEVHIEALILGLLHFTVTQGIANKDGRGLFAHLFNEPSVSNSPWTVKPEVGKALVPITVIRNDTADRPVHFVPYVYEDKQEDSGYKSHSNSRTNASPMNGLNIAIGTIENGGKFEFINAQRDVHIHWDGR